MAVPPAVELLPLPSPGRVFTDTRTVRLGDVDRRGRLRLDAAARFLQDVATDDASDADLDRRLGWVVRRTLIDTTTPASLGEPCVVSTWCTGIGRSWAERRSSIVGERGAQIDAVSLWVQIDVQTGKPARVGDDFRRAYADTANGRTVSARLSIPGPSGDEERTPWIVRRTDLDPFDHVNNAANWAMLEEAAELDTAHSRIGRAEMEYLQQVLREPGLDLACSVTSEVSSVWLLRGDDVLSAARWTPASGG